MPKKRNAGGRKAAGKRGSMTGPSAGWPRITGRIPGLVPGRESGLTWAAEPLKHSGRQLLEPKGKLGADDRTGVRSGDGTPRGERTGGPAPQANRARRPGPAALGPDRLAGGGGGRESGAGGGVHRGRR